MRSQTRLSGLRNTCIRAKCDNPHVCPATHRCLLYGAGRRTLSDYLICRIFVRAEPFWYLHMYFVQRAAPSQCVFAGVCPDTEQCYLALPKKSKRHKQGQRLLKLMKESVPLVFASLLSVLLRREIQQ